MTRIFISYSRKDLVFVERLSKDLTAAGLEVWYDLSGLEGGADFGREIQVAIRQCEYFVVVLSPNSIESGWVEKELMYAKSLKREIIPLLYQPCKAPLWSINLRFIDVQGENYDRHLWVILKIMGVDPVETLEAAEPEVAHSSTPALADQSAPPVGPIAADLESTPSRKSRRLHALLAGLAGLAALFAVGIWRLPVLRARLAPVPVLTAAATNLPSANPTPTPTPAPTLTSTLTIIPSPTFTPRPMLDPATGEVSGSMGWNNQPFAGVTVKLCAAWLYACSGLEFSAVTGTNGEFTISGVAPGDYQLITKYPGQIDETRLQDSSGTGQAGSPLIVKVRAGQLIGLNPISLCKDDLVVYGPKVIGNSVTFSWQAYPGVNSYNFSVSGTSFGYWYQPQTTYTISLPSGSYQAIISGYPACVMGYVNVTVP